MLIEIEDAILQRLRDKAFAVKELKSQAGSAGIPETGAYVSIEVGRMEKVTQEKHKLFLSIFLVLSFKNVAAESPRRRGVYPLVESAIQILFLQNLGLAIDPLRVKGFRNITRYEDSAAAKIVYQVEMETLYYLEKMSDEELADLITVGLNYYLAPDDGKADAQDLVALHS